MTHAKKEVLSTERKLSYKYKYRIKVIQKQIEEIKLSEEKEESDKNYTEDLVVDNPLPKKENGIKLLKFCPKCDTGNEPDTEVCVKCGHKFEK